ncbi:cytochrome P450 [Xylariomycetidae sp. FL2044]|nr:cytochrome P450 [Xylariomycetidae sp. FL2044]
MSLLGSDFAEPLTMFWLIFALMVGRYLWVTIKYTRAHLSNDTGQIPPLYPTFVPYIGVIFPFLWNGARFTRRLTSFSGKLTSSRIAVLPWWDLYFFQDPETVKQIWSCSQSLSTIKIRVFVYSYIFGLSKKGVSIIAADDSGPFTTPDPRSRVPDELRIHHRIHKTNYAALMGSGLKPLQDRFKGIFASKMDELSSSSENYTDIPDLRRFVHYSVGLPTIQAIFGPSFIRLNPEFMNYMFDFNSQMPRLAQGIPEIFMPGPYAIRRELHMCFKRWYQYARENFDESAIDRDGDGDPFWGSAWIKQRQEALTPIQDDDALAALDLGVAFGSIENTVNCATMALYHIIENEALLERVRQEVVSQIGEQSLAAADTQQLVASPLLSSLYAETLRLYVSTYTFVNSPHVDIRLGKWRLPKGSTGLVNSELLHMNSDLWKTRDGAHLVQSFWAERFLINPADPWSGPVRAVGPSVPGGRKQPAGEKRYFSLDGLEAAWIPYGGGRIMCPGRLMAKNTIIIACALLVRDFDFEITRKATEISKHGFGFGMRKPKQPIRCRLKTRQRHEVGKEMKA